MANAERVKGVPMSEFTRVIKGNIDERGYGTTLEEYDILFTRPFPRFVRQALELATFPADAKEETLP